MSIPIISLIVLLGLLYGVIEFIEWMEPDETANIPLSYEDWLAIQEWDLHEYY